MNPIKSSDLYQDDGALKKLVEDLKASETAAKKAMSEIRKEAEQLGNALNGVSGETVDQRAVIEATAKETDKLSKAYVRYQASLGDIGVQLQAVRNAQRDLNRVNRLEAKELAAKEGSYNQLSARLSLLKQRYKQLSAEERDNTKAGKELVKQINETNESLKDLDKRVGVHSRNVGNYKESIKEAVGEMGNLPGAAGAAAGGVQSLGQAFRVLIANPVVAVVAAIVAGLSALFNAFRQTASGAEFMRTATATIQGVLLGITKVLGGLAEGLVFTFSQPQEIIRKFGQVLIDQVVNRFKAVIKLGGAVAEFFSGNFSKAAAQAADATLQLVTGLDATDRAATTAAFSGGLSALKDLFVETGKVIQENVLLTRLLGEERRRVTIQNRDLARSVERYTTAEELAQITVDDTTRSLEERERAAQKARQALEARAQAEIKIARNNLGLINQQIAARKGLEDDQGLLDQQLQANQELARAERGLLVARRQNQRERDELSQEALERELDILIDGFDNQKSINERRAKDERISFEERRAILDETAELADASFARQIAAVEEYAGIKIDANELIEASDARVLQQRIVALGLEDVINGRILEAVRDRRTAIQDLSEAQTELTAAEAKAREEAFKGILADVEKRKEAQLKAFEQEQELQKSRVALTEQTAAERERTEIQFEIAKLQKILDVNEEFVKRYGFLYEGLTDDQAEIVKNQIAKLQNDLGDITQQSDGPQDLFDVLGFDIPDVKKEALKGAFDFAKDQLTEYIRVQKQLADQAVQEADRRVQAAQSALQAEISANQQGLASNVETRRQELEDAEAQQRKAVELQRKAARDERRIQTVQQAGNLVLASSKVLSQFGFPAALPIIALMFGAFAAAKLKAGQLAKQQQQFGAGGTGLFEGSGSHATGDHIAFGQSGNTSLVAEAGERWAIFRKDKTRKYGSTIPEVVDLLNAGRFEAVFQRRTIQNATAGIPFAPELHVNAPRTDMSRTEGYLQQIAKHGQRSEYIDAQGRRVVREGNVTTYYA